MARPKAELFEHEKLLGGAYPQLSVTPLKAPRFSQSIYLKVMLRDRASGRCRDALGLRVERLATGEGFGEKTIPLQRPGALDIFLLDPGQPASAQLKIRVSAQRVFDLGYVILLLCALTLLGFVDLSALGDFTNHRVRRSWIARGLMLVVLLALALPTFLGVDLVPHRQRDFDDKCPVEAPLKPR